MTDHRLASLFRIDEWKMKAERQYAKVCATYSAVGIEVGRLDGAFRNRGKHILIWRDRALDIIFNGPEWTT